MILLKIDKAILNFMCKYKGSRTVFPCKIMKKLILRELTLPDIQIYYKALVKKKEKKKMVWCLYNDTKINQINNWGHRNKSTHTDILLALKVTKQRSGEGTLSSINGTMSIAYPCEKKCYLTLTAHHVQKSVSGGL